MPVTNEYIWPGWTTGKLLGRDNLSDIYELERKVGDHEEKAALKVYAIPKHERDIEEMYAEGYDQSSVADILKNYADNIVDEYSRVAMLKDCAYIVGFEDIRKVPQKNGIGWNVLVKMERLTALPKALPEKIPEKLVIQVAYTVCAALMEAHNRGILHQEVRPQNIFQAENGEFKLGNLGVAGFSQRTTDYVTLTDYMFMAPEIYNNQPHSKASDLYSLGLVLYWMLNERRLPFAKQIVDGNSVKQAIKQRLAGDALPEPINGAAMLKDIVMKACAVKPEDRYKSAYEMLLDLEILDPDPTIGVFTFARQKKTTKNETKITESLDNPEVIAAPLSQACQATAEIEGRQKEGFRFFKKRKS